MKIEKISFNFSTEKLRGIKIYAPEAYESIERLLEEDMEKIYLKYVPKSTRQYIEAAISAEEASSGKWQCK